MMLNNRIAPPNEPLLILRRFSTRILSRTLSQTLSHLDLKTLSRSKGRSGEQLEDLERCKEQLEDLENLKI